MSFNWTFCFCLIMRETTLTLKAAVAQAHFEGTYGGYYGYSVERPTGIFLPLSSSSRLGCGGKRRAKKKETKSQREHQSEGKKERKLVSYSDFCWMILFLQKFWDEKEDKEIEELHSSFTLMLGADSEVWHWIFVCLSLSLRRNEPRFRGHVWCRNGATTSASNLNCAHSNEEATTGERHHQ